MSIAACGVSSPGAAWRGRCLLSWIPLIGLITFVLNVGAPRGSRRRRLAWTSLFVAAFMVCSSLGLVFVLYFTAFAAANANH